MLVHLSFLLMNFINIILTNNEINLNPSIPFCINKNEFFFLKMSDFILFSCHETTYDY